MKGARLALILSLTLLVVGFALALRYRQAPPTGNAENSQFVWPKRMRNAQVLSPDIGPDRLRNVMLNYSMALGADCTLCHVGAEGAPWTEVDFVSDANPHKNVARAMLRMVAQLNNQTLRAIPNLHHPQVSCYTCHRGQVSPATSPPVPTTRRSAQPQPAAHTGGHPQTG
jgi:hypothetical protein